MAESKPLRNWMQSVTWPDNAPNWSPLGKIDCVSLEEALSMIASTSSMPITTRRYYNGAKTALQSPQLPTSGWHGESVLGFNAGLSILDQQKAATPEMPLPETLQNHQAQHISVAPDDYERMSRRNAAWTEMIEKLRQLSGAVADLVNQMEKLR